MESALIAPSRILCAASLMERSVTHEHAYLDSDDSAFYALTDFRREYPITVDADGSIDAALGDMDRLGVHALLVTREESRGLGPQIVGLVTHHDIQRRRSHRCPQEAVSGEHGLCRISEVMTPWNELSLVKFESLQGLSAADLYDMFQGTGLTHLLVVEAQDDEPALALGLVSRAALGKRLRRDAVPSAC
jgi:CBS domain-containing protein